MKVRCDHCRKLSQAKAWASDCLGTPYGKGQIRCPECGKQGLKKIAKEGPKRVDK